MGSQNNSDIYSIKKGILPAIRFGFRVSQFKNAKARAHVHSCGGGEELQIIVWSNDEGGPTFSMGLEYSA